MTTPRALTRLEVDILRARRNQLAKRIDWSRSPNAATIAAEQAATHLLNQLLDLWPRP